MRPVAPRLLVAAVAGSAALAAGVLAGVAPATASTAATFNLSAGSAPVGTVVQVNGVTTGSSPQVTLTDVTNGVTAACDSGSGAGSFKVGNNLPGTAIGQLDGSKLQTVNCIGPLNLKLGLVATGLWNLNVTKVVNGVSSGSLTGISATVIDINTNGAACKFTATGSVKGKFTVRTQTLSTNANAATLKISNVQGCFGQVANGDKATIGIQIKLSPVNPAFRPISISQN